MTSMARPFSIAKVWLLAAASAITLLGCGGGGGGGEPAASVQILDSFGREVAAGDGGVGVGDSGADGTAGDGAAVVGGTVVVTDSRGQSASATTDAQGYYRVKVTGFVPPFVAKVTKTDGRVLHSLNVKEIKVNGFITLNLTGLTDKVASDVARAGGKSGAADLTPQIVAANTGAIAASVNSLKSQIAPVITAAAIDPATFDPLSVPFRPDHTGYDFVLDNTVITVGPDGQTQVAVSPTFAASGALSGTWTATITSASFPTGTFAPFDVPGANVPKDATAAAAGCVSPITQTSNGATATCNGNVVTVTLPDGSVANVSIVLLSYQGCGSCGIGSQVAVTFRLTESGAQSTTFDYTVTYVRKS